MKPPHKILTLFKKLKFLGGTDYASIDGGQCYCDYKLDIQGISNIYVMINKPLAEDTCNKLTEWEGFENL